MLAGLPPACTTPLQAVSFLRPATLPRPRPLPQDEPAPRREGQSQALFILGSNRLTCRSPLPQKPDKKKLKRRVLQAVWRANGGELSRPASGR